MDISKNQHVPVEKKPELIEIITKKIKVQGGISFSDFMELALYHPQYGYYTSPRTRIGKEGDFFTSSSVHSLFGGLIAVQLEQMWKILGCGKFIIAEQGAGEGHLALDILDTIAAKFPEFYTRLSYRIIEISPDHKVGQSSVLDKHVRAGRVEWCTLAQVGGMQGCFLTNELVDAFPVHLVEKHRDQIQEVFITADDGGFKEELRPLDNVEIEKYFDLVEIEPAEGNRAEVNLQALDWMAQVAEVLSRGFVLTIDYGHPAAELLAPYRKTGTLLCYHRHQSNEEPLQRAGCQDITAHIDFTALQKVGERSGLDHLYFGEQYRFLMGLGFLEALLELQMQETDPRQAQALRMTLKNLIMPEGGMGESFKILIQGKGVGRPELKCARKIRDISLPPGMLG